MTNKEIDLWTAAFIAGYTEGLKTPLLFAQGRIPQLIEGAAACADAAVGELRKRTKPNEVRK